MGAAAGGSRGATGAGPPSREPTRPMAQGRHGNGNVSGWWVPPTRRLPAQHPHCRAGKPKSSPGHIWKSAEAATALPCGARVSRPVNPVPHSPGARPRELLGEGAGGEWGRAPRGKCAGKRQEDRDRAWDRAGGQAGGGFLGSQTTEQEAEPGPTQAEPSPQPAGQAGLRPGASGWPRASGRQQRSDGLCSPPRHPCAR